MTHCSIYYSGYQDIRKIEKLRIHTLDIYCLSLSSILANKSEDKGSFPNIFIEYERESGDYIYMT